MEGISIIASLGQRVSLPYLYLANPTLLIWQCSQWFTFTCPTRYHVSNRAAPQNLYFGHIKFLMQETAEAMISIMRQTM
jgi:hypothetical protein